VAQELRVGFIGVGGIARHHLKKLSEIPEARPVAFCDVDLSRAEEAAKPCGGRAYSDYRRMLEAGGLDAVYVCVPPSAHGSIETDCSDEGLALFVEKPVNLYLDEARRISRRIEKKGVVNAVGYSLRYSAGARQAKAFFDGTPPLLAQCERWGGLPKTPWWGRYAMSGGQLVEMFTHQVDLLRWWMGEVKSVYARYDWAAPAEGSDVPRLQAVVLNFESGATALLSCTCAIEGWRGAAEFVLRGGWASWEGEGLKVEPAGKLPLPPKPDDAPGVDLAFVSAALARSQAGILTPYADGVTSLAVTLAANESARRMKEVVVAKAKGDPRPPAADKAGAAPAGRRSEP